MPELWLDADPPTWDFPDETPPHVLAGLRRLFATYGRVERQIKFNRSKRIDGRRFACTPSA